MSAPSVRRRIVAIDDDPMFGVLIKHALGDHAVDTFEDPAQAIAAISGNPPDLVITDLSMPQMSGLSVIQAIREVHTSGRLPIIVYSGEGGEEAILECFAAGANDYLVKPLETGQLRAKVALLLARTGARGGVRSIIAAGGTFAGYRLVREVGRGGMGVVYEAVTPDGAHVALKLLTPDVSGDQPQLARFLREAELLKSVRHPGIASFLAFGHEDLRYFIAMEFVDGPNLETWVNGRLPLPEAEAVDCVKQIALALDALHGAGIVHRDVKPQNVLVAPGGVLKLADFGVAKRFDSVRLTAPNGYVGSPEYLAPELCQGKAPLDIRSDLYSLGVTFYYLATGQLPFVGDESIAIIYQHINREPASPRQVNSHLSERVAAMIMKLLAKKLTDRYQTPAELLAAIERSAASSVPAHKPRWWFGRKGSTG